MRRPQRLRVGPFIKEAPGPVRYSGRSIRDMKPACSRGNTKDKERASLTTALVGKSTSPEGRSKLERKRACSGLAFSGGGPFHFAPKISTTASLFNRFRLHHTHRLGLRHGQAHRRLVRSGSEAIDTADRAMNYVCPSVAPGSHFVSAQFRSGSGGTVTLDFCTTTLSWVK